MFKWQSVFCSFPLSYRRHSIFLFIIVLFGAFLRIWQLGIVPQGVTHDELGYIFNAYSIALTGKNVFGQTLPLFTWMVSGGFPFMPVTIYGIVPIFWIMPLSAFTGRFPSALLGTFDILLLYIIIVQIFKNRPLGLLSALFLAISPWHLHFSRSAYDPNFALFFYMLGIALFIFEIKNKRLPVFSAVSIFLAIYSYRGMSIIAFPLLLTLLIYGKYVLNASKKQIIFFVFSSVFIAISLLFVIMRFGNAYTAEGVSLFSNPKMQENIDLKIREADGPLLIRRIFINKPLYIVNSFRENYIKAYSPEYLFLYTEPHEIYSIWSRGRIYFIDVFFIFLGFYFLIRRYKPGAFFVISLFLIGGLPGGVGGMPYSARNFFLSVVFPILSAAGIMFVLSQRILEKIKIPVVLVFIVIYSFVLFGYLFDYYLRYANQNAEAWAKSLKEVSIYVNDQKNQFDSVVVAPTSFGDVVQYAFYTKIPAHELQGIWSSKTIGSSIEKFQYKNVTFLSACINNKTLLKKEKILFITRGDCMKDATSSAQIRDFNKNTLWKLYY